MKNLTLFFAIVLFPFYLQAQAPTYSEGTTEYWYYIQFNYTGYVIQSNGEDQILTVQEPVAGNDNQLWKVEWVLSGFVIQGYEESDLVKISNKANPELAIRYLTSSEIPGISSRFYATQRAGAYDMGDEMNNPALVTDYWEGMVALNARNSNYFMMPQGDTLRAAVYRDGSGNPNKDKCALKFVLPENMFTGIKSTETPDSKMKISLNPASNYLSVELPDGAKSLTIINTAGQTVETLKPSGIREQIDLSRRTPGIYILKVEKPTGVEIVKLGIARSAF
jgi:hypothetical protein